ncbi:peptidase M61 [Brevundimonas sp. LM2]|uniref:M61 family metallopeptidase n=1 Tax=Brevundimonas sp. LM2 TaxID=1938605 RepID=UPI000983BA99|nr:PDZ domain-containing protein [Brevundimonas sp. LM2]AQR62707.1 peptidase M61 [Brevundimonas sp. LM2]
MQTKVWALATTILVGWSGLAQAHTAGAHTAGAQAARAGAAASAPVEYDLRFDNAVHQEARITVTWREIGDRPLRVQMSRSSPGRYALHEFAKNVYSVSATDGAGRPLSLQRTDPYGWTVPGHDGTVVLTYTLYADRADGTYSQIDATHAHLNMPATLMWATGFDDRPALVRFRPYAPDWTIATQLEPTAAADTFTAPDLQYLMDSPTELSAHAVRAWQVDDDGVARTIRLTVHHAGTEAEVDTFAAKAKKVVDQQIAVFGDVPDFDYGTYTFLADYLPHVTGDGMEHRNSTVISSTRSFQQTNFGQLGTLSHEFFHAWNVERIRPAELEPFDFTRANPTPSLWFAEGFTNYYGPLAIRRAGESTVDAFLADLSRTLSGIVNAPGRAYGSPQEMSLRAPFADAAAAIDPTNPNISTSYYPYGQIVALALDLSLRERFPGVTLDDYMRRMWQVHGVTERPYTPDDLRLVLGAVTGDQAFADAFFATSVEGSALPDFAPLLAQAGLVLAPARPEAAWAAAAPIRATGTALMVTEAPAPQTPLYEAGLDRGDEIVSVDDTAMDSDADWTGMLRARQPGDTVQIRFLQRGVERTVAVRLAADPALQIVRAEATGGALTDAQRAFRASWLGVE